MHVSCACFMLFFSRSCMTFKFSVYIAGKSFRSIVSGWKATFLVMILEQTQRDLTVSLE